MNDLFVQVLKHSTEIEYVIGGLIAVVLFVAAVKYDNYVRGGYRDDDM